MKSLLCLTISLLILTNCKPRSTEPSSSDVLETAQITAPYICRTMEPGGTILYTIESIVFEITKNSGNTDAYKKSFDPKNFPFWVKFTAQYKDKDRKIAVQESPARGSVSDEGLFIQFFELNWNSTERKSSANGSLTEIKATVRNSDSYTGTVSPADWQMSPTFFKGNYGPRNYKISCAKNVPPAAENKEESN